MNKKIILFFMLLFLTSCSNQTIDLMAYANIDFIGFEGKGEAILTIDFEKLKSDLAVDEELNKLDIENITDSLTYSLNKQTDLSNGDKVLISADWDKKISRKYKVQFKADELEIVVKNLNDSSKQDIFKDLEIKVLGNSPFLKLSLENKSDDEFIKNVKFSIKDPKEHYKNLDKITLFVDIDEKESLKAGYLFSSFEKQYTVKSENEYISKFESIGDKNYNDIKKYAKEHLEAKLATDGEFAYLLYPRSVTAGKVKLDSLKISSLELKHAYFFIIKDDFITGEYDFFNMFYLVYKVNFKTNITPADKDLDTAYIPIKFYNILKNADNKIIVDYKNVTTTEGLSNQYEDMYTDVVSINKSKYDYEGFDY